MPAIFFLWPKSRRCTAARLWTRLRAQCAGERCSFAAERGRAVDIRYLKGVGEKRAAQLAKLGIHTTEDLLGFYPRDHID